jgi:hypothetical protein
MTAQYSTDTVIEEMVAAVYGNTVSERQKHLYRETLRALVRLAKAEQMKDMRRDVLKVTGEPLPDLHHHGETK